MRDKFTINLGGYAMALMMVLIVAQVIARYVFKSPFSWTEELTRAVFVWATMIAVYMALKQKRHIGIEAIPRFMGNAGQKTVKVIEILLVLFFLGVMTWQGTLYAMMVKQKTPALSIPMTLIYGIIPLTGAVMIIESISQIISLLRCERKVEQL